MKKLFKSFVFLVGILFCFNSCLSLDSISDVIEMADTGEKVVKSVQAISRAASDITPEEEYSIGRISAATIIEKYDGLYSDEKKEKYLNNICGALVINSEKPYLYKGYSVGLLNSNDINAISTPGGHIFITKGMYDLATSEDELAAILAHEIAHIQLNHASNTIKTSRTTQAVFTTVQAVDSIVRDSSEREEMAWVNEISTEYVEKLITDGFSSELEYEADSYALTLLLDAGYDANAMIEVLNALNKNNKDKFTFDLTHPKPSSRIEKVSKVLKNEPFISSKANKEDRMARFNKYR